MQETRVEVWNELLSGFGSKYIVFV